MSHKGSCHCGAVTFEATGDIPQVIECNCSHCIRKGYLLWFVPRDKLTITKGEDALGTYTFNKHVIKHKFCKTCGCAPFGFAEDPKKGPTVAVNVRCIPDVDISSVKRVPVDGKNY